MNSFIHLQLITLQIAREQDQIPVVPEFRTYLFWGFIVIVGILVSILFLRSRGRATQEAELGEYQFHWVRGKRTIWGGFLTKAEAFIEQYNIDALEMSQDPEIITAVKELKKHLHAGHFAYAARQRGIESGTKQYQKNAFILSSRNLEEHRYYDQLPRTFRILGLGWTSVRRVIISQESVFCGSVDKWDLFYIDPIRLDSENVVSVDPNPEANEADITTKTGMVQAAFTLKAAANNLLGEKRVEEELKTMKRQYNKVLGKLNEVSAQLAVMLRISAQENPWGGILGGMLNPQVNPFIVATFTLMGAIAGVYAVPLYNPTIEPLMGGFFTGAAILVAIYFFYGGSGNTGTRTQENVAGT